MYWRRWLLAALLAATGGLPAVLAGRETGAAKGSPQITWKKIVLDRNPIIKDTSFYAVGYGGATINRRATIYLIILPIEARWFLGIEVLFAFMGFLVTHDLAGFLGICAAVGATNAFLATGGFLGLHAVGSRAGDPLCLRVGDEAQGKEAGGLHHQVKCAGLRHGVVGSCL